MNDRNRDPHLDSLLPKIPVDRRGFIVSTLAAGFAAPAQPVMAQTMIVTDTQGLAAGEAKVPVKDGSIPVYYARPAAGDRFPVIIVVPEIFGVHEHIRDVARRHQPRRHHQLLPRRPHGVDVRRVSTAASTRTSRTTPSTSCTARSRPGESRARSSSTKACRTPSTPTTVRRTARKPPRTAGAACSTGSVSTDSGVEA